jgi:TrpR family trp operon transcriptional repressor
MKHLDELINILMNMKNKADMEDFLYGILTPKELEEIPNRLKIVKMLKKGTPQVDIAKRLGVGIATVTRGSKQLQENRFKYI